MFFEARASSEGTTASASSVVGIDFARAYGNSESVGIVSVRALSTAVTVATYPPGNLAEAAVTSIDQHVGDVRAGCYWQGATARSISAMCHYYPTPTQGRKGSVRFEKRLVTAPFAPT